MKRKEFDELTDEEKKRWFFEYGYENIYLPQFFSQLEYDKLEPCPIANTPSYCRAYSEGFSICMKIINSRFNLVEKKEYDDIVF